MIGERTKFKDAVMRIALFCVTFITVIPLAQMNGASLEITIPVTLFVWLSMTFVCLWLIDQWIPFLTSFCNVLLTYNKDIKKSDEMTEWCKDNITNFWLEIDGIYYFLFKRDAMAFKLVWI